MMAFTYERDLDHPVSAELDQTIRDGLEGCLTNQGLEGVLVNPGLDHDGDPVLFVHVKFCLVEPGIDPRRLSDSAISLRRALWAIGERRFPHLRTSATTSTTTSGSSARRTGEWLSPGMTRS